MSEPLRVTARVEIPADELSWRFTRSSGPGGQNVNKTSTRVELSFDVHTSRAFGDTLRARAIERLASRLRDGVITVVASDERSQARNRDLARERLAQTLRIAIAPPPKVRLKTRPSRGSVERRLTAKKRRGDLKRDRRVTDD